MTASSNAGSSERPRVVIVRGHQANPWELRPWQQAAISERFDACFLRTRRGWFDTSSLLLPSESVLAMRDLLPPGRLGDMLVRFPGDRYLGLRAKLQGADIVHTQELGYWYSMQVAKLKQQLGFQMVTTVWETIPFMGTYRNVRTRAYRTQVLAQTDLFLAATERARMSLLLEGAPADRIRVCAPGIDTERFTGHAAQRPQSCQGDDRGQTGRGDDRGLILSAGRLVWEKGHQDVLRAVALVRHGLLPGASANENVRLCIVGSGPEEQRLRAYARELEIADAVEFRGFIPYDEMPDVYASAVCMVLASLPIWSWEEQFGMVLAEAMAAGTPILASASGAIPEVVGDAAERFSPGDWPTLAQQLTTVIERGRSESPATREHARAYSTEAAAMRIRAAYEELLGKGGR